MIELNRVNHQALILNCDLIKFIERAHDTVITLLNGEKLTVEESPEEILRLIAAYRRQAGAAGLAPMWRTLPPGWRPEADAAEQAAG